MTTPTRRRLSLRGLDREAAIAKLRAWLTAIVTDADRAALTRALLYGGDAFDAEQWDAATEGPKAACAQSVEDAIAWFEGVLDEARKA